MSFGLSAKPSNDGPETPHMRCSEPLRVPLSLKSLAKRFQRPSRPDPEYFQQKMNPAINFKRSTFLGCVIAFLLVSCDSRDTPDEAQATAPKMANPMNQPEIPKETKDKLKAIYEEAPARRAATDAAVSGSSNPLRVDNNTEAPKLEDVFKGLGWGIVTVTEGVKLSSESGLLWRLEVIDSNAQDWFVEVVTDEAITTGKVKVKSKDSPWHK